MGLGFGLHRGTECLNGRQTAEGRRQKADGRKLVFRFAMTNEKYEKCQMRYGKFFHFSFVIEEQEKNSLLRSCLLPPASCFLPPAVFTFHAVSRETHH